MRCSLRSATAYCVNNFAGYSTLHTADAVSRTDQRSSNTLMSTEFSRAPLIQRNASTRLCAGLGMRKTFKFSSLDIKCIPSACVECDVTIGCDVIIRPSSDCRVSMFLTIIAGAPVPKKLQVARSAVMVYLSSLPSYIHQFDE